ncbi:MAG: hypothetical protein K2G67_07755 [Muribaculaceae bacterium]|nr:hypothetical protein [Muribaculaceae bacterium]
MDIIEEQYIFGIKVNGCSQYITKLSISENQSSYDYICNVTLGSQKNGNGRFRVSFINSERNEGLPIGEWILLRGEIRYDWGSASAYFKMQDELGEQTEEIKASTDKGSASGFSVEALTRSICTKANEIVDRFPSAKIFNAYQEVVVSMPMNSHLLMYKEANEVKYLIDRFENYTIKPLLTYLNKFRKFQSLMKDKDDIKAKRLLTEISDEVLKIISLF